MEIKKVDEKEYEKDRFSELKDEVFEYTRRNPINEEIRNNHNTLFLKRSLFSDDIHVREMLGYLLAKKCGIPVCETELAIYPTGVEGKFENAVISYSEVASDEKTLLPIDFVRKYRDRVGITNEDIYWMLDVESILNTVFGMMQENGRPLEEFDKFLQDFIDMMIFDIAFVNSDRDHKNWHIRQNINNGKIELYPLFDNASIFATEKDYKKPVTDDEALKLSEDHPLSILTLEDYLNGKHYTSYQDMLKFLLNRYPKETRKSLDKVSIIDEETLEELIDSIPDVDPIRKDQMLKVFKYRKKGIETILSKEKVLEKENS